MSESTAINQNIVVVGGGTAGWMTALTMAHFFADTGLRVTLVESEEVGIVGVGEATIPPILDYHRIIGINENKFLSACQATFKLGIEFVNWSTLGSQYMHPFGQFGQPLDGLPFHHHWLRYRALQQKKDSPYHSLDDFSLAARAAYAGKFMRPIDAPNTPLAHIRHAFHFDAHLYGRFLRQIAERKGVERIEGKITSVTCDGETGDVRTLQLSDGRGISGDFFIDCSGFRSLLLGETLKVPFQDWSQWLPCDSAVAVPCASAGPPDSHTRATAHSAGWQWHIPLQHRVGNGHVFASAFMDQEEASRILLTNLDGEALAEPRLLRFKAGRREEFWRGNVVAIGLSAGFLEPLESTSIHLTQSAIMRLIALMPRGKSNPTSAAVFNRLTAQEYDHIRDFVILHYHQTQRSDSDFWNYVRTMAVPDSLTERILLYRETGRIMEAHDDLFGEANWLAVLEGQGVAATNWHPAADRMTNAELTERLGRIENVVARSVDYMPGHQEFIDTDCAVVETV
jgi:tryptophan 7-halogenase